MAQYISSSELERLAKNDTQEYKFFEVVNGLENKYKEKGNYYSYWVLQDGTILECMNCHCSIECWIAQNFIINGYEIEDNDENNDTIISIVDDYYDYEINDWDRHGFTGTLNNFLLGLFEDSEVEDEYYAARNWGAIRVTFIVSSETLFIKVPLEFKMTSSQLNSIKTLITEWHSKYYSTGDYVLLISDFDNHIKSFYDFTDPDYTIKNIINNLNYYNTMGKFRNENVDEKLNEELLLLEKTRGELVAKSKNSDDYKGDKSKGRNRWFRGQKLKPVESKDNYNKIDMDSLWKKDILDVDIYVYGETDIYTVRVKIRDVIKELAKEVEDNHQQYEYKCIYRALQRAIESDKVWVSCDCKDFQYRIKFFATQQDYNSGDPENRPSDITNPNDTKGAGCKHVNCLLSNIGWLLNIASVINNYIYYMKKTKPQLFADYIFPKIFGMKYEKAVQLDLFDDQELKSDSEIIALANEYNRRRTQFKTASEYATADKDTNLGKEEPQEQQEESTEQEEPTHESLKLKENKKKYLSADDIEELIKKGVNSENYFSVTTSLNDWDIENESPIFILQDGTYIICDSEHTDIEHWIADQYTDKGYEVEDFDPNHIQSWNIYPTRKWGAVQYRSFASYNNTINIILPDTYNTNTTQKNKIKDILYREYDKGFRGEVRLDIEKIGAVDKLFNFDIENIDKTIKNILNNIDYFNTNGCFRNPGLTESTNYISSTELRNLAKENGQEYVWFSINDKYDDLWYGFWILDDGTILEPFAEHGSIELWIYENFYKKGIQVEGFNPTEKEVEELDNYIKKYRNSNHHSTPPTINYDFYPEKYWNAIRWTGGGVDSTDFDIVLPQTITTAQIKKLSDLISYNFDYNDEVKIGLHGNEEKYFEINKETNTDKTLKNIVNNLNLYKTSGKFRNQGVVETLNKSIEISASSLEQMAKENNQEFTWFTSTKDISNLGCGFWILQDGTILDCDMEHTSIERWMLDNFIAEGDKIEGFNPSEELVQQFIDDPIGFDELGFDAEIEEPELYATRMWGAVRVGGEDELYIQLPTQFKISEKQKQVIQQIILYREVVAVDLYDYDENDKYFKLKDGGEIDNWAKNIINHITYYSNNHKFKNQDVVETYIGKSMSVRAKQAYENEEKPISKWTKQEILDDIKDLFPDLTDEQTNTLQQMSVQDLKNKFLTKSSWHHTGKYYNQTNFYSIDASAVDEFFTPKQEIEVDLTTLPYYEFVIYVDSSLSRLGSKVVYNQTTHDKWNLNKSYNEIKNEAVEQLKHFNEIYKNATLFIYANNHKLIDKIKGDLI